MFDLFLPERCLHCDQPSIHSMNGAGSGMLSHYICEVCLRILEHQEPPNEDYFRNQFDRVAPGLELAYSSAAYSFRAESPMQSIIHAFKYSGMQRLAKTFGTGISGLAPAITSVVIPVPLHRTRLAERGYNQAEALAIGIAKRSKIHVIHALKRIRPTPSQTHLTLTERIDNVQGAFALTRHASAIKGKNVLIVDDVMTTGSTLASVAETVFAAKPKSVSILALAAATIV
jgi:ComF family protein